MVSPKDLAQLESDFLAGRNPLGYLPVCQALRKRRQFARALELCQRGLAIDATSLAGRTLHVRLLNDLGRYVEALREVERLAAEHPDLLGVQVEQARCLMGLGRHQDAGPVIERLNALNPLDPQVQMITNDHIRATAQHSRESVRVDGLLRSATPAVVSGPARTMTYGEMLAAVTAEVAPLARVLSAAVIPVGAGAPAVEGDAMAAEAGYLFFKETNIACRELDSGGFRMGMIETDRAQMLVVARRDVVVTLAVEPTSNPGRIFHRLHDTLERLMPPARPAGAVRSNT